MRVWSYSVRRGALRVAYLRVLASGGHSGLASFTVIGPAIFLELSVWLCSSVHTSFGLENRELHA